MSAPVLWLLKPRITASPERCVVRLLFRCVQLAENGEDHVTAARIAAKRVSLEKSSGSAVRCGPLPTEVESCIRAPHCARRGKSLPAAVGSLAVGETRMRRPDCQNSARQGDLAPFHRGDSPTKTTCAPAVRSSRAPASETVAAAIRRRRRSKSIRPGRCCVARRRRAR